MVWGFFKDFGGAIGDHFKVSINNLFTNFKESNIMANIYIQNCYHKKCIDFPSHPQYMAPKDKSIVLIVANGRAAIFEEFDIPKVVDGKSGSNSPPFVLVGDKFGCH